MIEGVGCMQHGERGGYKILCMSEAKHLKKWQWYLEVSDNSIPAAMCQFCKTIEFCHFFLTKNSEH